MARLPAVIEVVAKHDRRSPATISNYARVIREAGYLPKGKRGVGAAHLSPEHAANLVMALAGASEAVSGPLAIEALRKATLSPDATMDGERVDARDLMAQWSLAPFSENFGKILEGLVSFEPHRLGADLRHKGVLEVSVTISEVDPEEGEAFVDLLLVDEGQEARFRFLSIAPDALEKLESFSLFRDPRDWTRSTRVGTFFFQDMGICISGDLDARGSAETANGERHD